MTQRAKIRWILLAILAIVIVIVDMQVIMNGINESIDFHDWGYLFSGIGAVMMSISCFYFIVIFPKLIRKLNQVRSNEEPHHKK